MWTVDVNELIKIVHINLEINRGDKDKLVFNCTFKKMVTKTSNGLEYVGRKRDKALHRAHGCELFRQDFRMKIGNKKSGTKLGQMGSFCLCLSLSMMMMMGAVTGSHTEERLLPLQDSFCPKTLRKIGFE